MTRVPTITTVIYSVILCSGAWLGTVAPAQAGTVTDMFGVTMIGKRWCEGNPKFSENFTVKIDPKNLTTNTTLTIMRDVLNTGDLTDIQATITTHGESTDLDAIALNGLTFPRNTSHSIAELVLSGTNPSNPDHFFTIRGQATLDKLDNLTKVTGTFLFQETNIYTTDTKTGTQSGPVACFTSGTFRTNQKLSSSGGDFDNYFPFTQGNTWNFQGTVVETGQPTIHYQMWSRLMGPDSLVGSMPRCAQKATRVVLVRRRTSMLRKMTQVSRIMGITIQLIPSRPR